MPITVLKQFRGDSDKLHDETLGEVKPIPPTSIDKVCIALGSIIKRADANALLAVFNETFLLDSYSFMEDDGHYTNYYHANRTRPTLEALFIHYPEKFLDIFRQLKDNAELYAAFQTAMAKTDLQALEKEWDDKTLQSINAGIKELDKHSQKLTLENAISDATHVTTLSTNLKTILQCSDEKPDNGVHSSAPLLIKSPNLKQRVEFVATLHAKDSHLDNHRKFWKVVLANILCLGVGVLYGWLSDKKKPYFFANTDRQNKVDHIHEAIDPRKVLSNF